MLKGILELDRQGKFYNIYVEYTTILLHVPISSTFWCCRLEQTCFSPFAVTPAQPVTAANRTRQNGHRDQDRGEKGGGGSNTT